MNTTNAAVATGVVVVLGRWSEGKWISMRVVVGVLFLAFILSVLPEKIATPITYLILTAVVFTYAPGIINKSGIAKSPTDARGQTGAPGLGGAVGPTV